MQIAFVVGGVSFIQTPCEYASKRPLKKKSFSFSFNNLVDSTQTSELLQLVQVCLFTVK